jgi:hypothetical protein
VKARCLLLAMLIAGAASAEESYGTPILVVDGIAIAATGAAAAIAASDHNANRPALVLGAVGVGGFLLAGPIAHWSRGNAGRGFGSLGMRIGLPLAGALLGAVVACAGHYCFGNSNEQQLPEASSVPPIVGVSLGVLGAAAIDAFVLAVDEPVTIVPAGRGVALRMRF